MAEFFLQQVFRKDQSIEDSVKAYSDLGETYDTMVKRIDYCGPKKTAQLVSELFPSREGVKILDLGCGTGLVAELLRQHGFNHIDGVDPAQGLLDVAQAKSLYNTALCSLVGVEDQPLAFPDDSYDVITVCGAMGHNMIPCQGIHEMIRLAKPGGYVVNLFREEILTIVPEYTDRLEPMIEQLEQEGKWRRVRRDRFPEYQVDRDGIIYVHQVC